MVEQDLTIEPGSTIGIMGGGQLGRMIALAASNLGYRIAVFCESEDDPATQVCQKAVIAPFNDFLALKKFTSMADVITFEFENVPAEAANFLEAHSLVRPKPKVLAIAQDRILEKTFLNEIGIETAPWAQINQADHISRAMLSLGHDAIFKTARFGYDGKGQATIRGDQALLDTWIAAGKPPSIAEGIVDFACEISVIIARGLDGKTQCYDIAENQHRNHILDTTIAPGRVDFEISEQAKIIAEKIANSLSLVGLIAIEMFVTKDRRILVNEIAPRPHNSGHWTIDACVTSQFEQLVRAICGLPLGSPQRHSNALMRNLLGKDVERWPQIIADGENKLHLYGKRGAPPGRKMGHVTRLFPLSPSWDSVTLDTAMTSIRENS
ncbi:MAG: 5-(carboxyamino)imidazole ribonucleotide synthase [Rhodospirillaceae bacterium]